MSIKLNKSYCITIDSRVLHLFTHKSMQKLATVIMGSKIKSVKAINMFCRYFCLRLFVCTQPNIQVRTVYLR